MKKEIMIGLFLCGVVILALAWNFKNDLRPQIRTTKLTPASILSSPSVTPTTFTMSDVQKHNSASSCWFVVQGNVYDVTNAIAQHPGGENAILNNCGADATQAFATKGGKGDPHSNRAQQDLQTLMIGKLR